MNDTPTYEPPSRSDLESRKIARFAAERYCELNNIDPDDKALDDWRDGVQSDARLLFGNAKNLIREQSRQIAVSVAGAVWKINRKEGHLDVSKHYDQLCEVIGERLADLIDQAKLDASIVDILDDLEK